LEETKELGASALSPPMQSNRSARGSSATRCHIDASANDDRGSVVTSNISFSLAHLRTPSGSSHLTVFKPGRAANHR
jgi:hypothetical protein